MTQEEFKLCARTAPNPDGSDTFCGKVYVPKTHNQLFCTSECTRIQTNANIMAKYYEEKLRLSGATRYCSICKETKLSQYNDTTVCSLCRTRQRQAVEERAHKLLDNLGN